MDDSFFAKDEIYDVSGETLEHIDSDIPVKTKVFLYLFVVLSFCLAWRIFSPHNCKKKKLLTVVCLFRQLSIEANNEYLSLGRIASE